MEKKYAIASIILICAMIVSATYAIQANPGNPFDDYLRANSWSYNEFRRMVNKGNFTEDIGKNLGSTSYVDYWTVHNVTELSNHAKLVIRGVVESSKVNATFDPQGIDMPDVYTKFTIRIKEVLKGDYSEPTIVVDQKGGTYRGSVWTVKNDPLMKEGDEVILYLNWCVDRYRIYGGPQGRFQIVDGRLYNIAEIDPSIGIVVKDGLKMNGADSSQLRELLHP